MSYYENVRVPKENIVGGLHGGWKLITSQLNHERVGLALADERALAARRLDRGIGVRVRIDGRIVGDG